MPHKPNDANCTRFPENSNGPVVFNVAGTVLLPYARGSAQRLGGALPVVAKALMNLEGLQELGKIGVAVESKGLPQLPSLYEYEGETSLGDGWYFRITRPTSGVRARLEPITKEVALHLTRESPNSVLIVSKNVQDAIHRNAPLKLSQGRKAIYLTDSPRALVAVAVDRSLKPSLTPSRILRVGDDKRVEVTLPGGKHKMFVPADSVRVVPLIRAKPQHSESMTVYGHEVLAT